MGKPKLKKINNEPIHYSVGAVIEKDGNYLLIDRKNPPYGFAGIAGHIDEGEKPIEALKREVFEESQLKVKNQELLFEEELDWNYCSKGINTHYWYLYDCTWKGKVKKNNEAKSIGWYSKEEIQELNRGNKLEEVWKYWFEKLGILK